MWKMSSGNQSLKIASSQQIDKIKNLLTGLGKPTKRGIRKCPSCGTFNGTRGISCKNKACNAVFKEKNFKKERSADAVKLISGSGAQIYSVRLRDKGQDSRGFVELPIIHDNEGQTLNREDVAIDERVIMEAARCYVENCPRSMGITNGISCVHINAAINCKLFAESLTFKNNILESLPADEEVKRLIFSMATELPGPIAQRVTKNTMVVKCMATEKHPLGILHVTFPDLNKKDSRYLCGCKDKKVPNDDKRCIHVLSCVCCFISDEKLNLEFENCIKHVLSSPEACIVVYTNEVEKEHQVTLSEETMNATEMIDDVSINEQTDDSKTYMIIDDQVIGVAEINQLEEEPVEKKMKTISVEQDLIQHITSSERVGELSSGEKSDDSDINRVLVEEDDVAEFQNPSLSSPMSNVIPVRPKPVQLKMPRNAPPRTLTLQTSSLHTASVLYEQNLSYYVNKQILPPNSSNLQEDDLHISFLTWLSGVTERINSTMHYQFSVN
ncbi:DgyrCDS10231 [Dimorphilus gyrociliatus]|uniref:DgyrCDS10231 n=1 Tax=Dimorphilus gyrociliatus TaxID=2664684 RepID=A0A7I8W0Z8_9ANNE|nr:DgyrCDS10231 [Dimorphilus gyrociliatus]